MQSKAGGIYEYMKGFIQFDREEVWDTTARGIPPFAKVTNTWGAADSCYGMEYITSDGITRSGTGVSTAPLSILTKYGGGTSAMNVHLGSIASSSLSMDTDLDLAHAMLEFYFAEIESSYRYATGKVHDMYIATYATGIQGDDLTIGGVDYIIWEATSLYRVAVRKG